MTGGLDVSRTIEFEIMWTSSLYKSSQKSHKIPNQTTCLCEFTPKCGKQFDDCNVAVQETILYAVYSVQLYIGGAIRYHTLIVIRRMQA